MESNPCSPGLPLGQPAAEGEAEAPRPPETAPRGAVLACIFWGEKKSGSSSSSSSRNTRNREAGRGRVLL